MDQLRHIMKHVNVADYTNSFKHYNEFLIMPFIIFMFLEVLKFLFLLLGGVECVGAGGSVEDFLANPPGDMAYINLTCATEIKYKAFSLFIYSFLYIIIVCAGIYVNGTYVERINEAVYTLDEAQEQQQAAQIGQEQLRQSQELVQQQVSSTPMGGLLGNALFNRKRPRSMTTVVNVNRRAVQTQNHLRKLLGRFSKVKFVGVICYSTLLLTMLLMTYVSPNIRSIYNPHMSECKDLQWNRPRQNEYRCHFNSELMIYALALVADMFRGLFLLSAVGSVYSLRRYRKYAEDTILKAEFGNLSPALARSPSAGGAGSPHRSSPLRGHDDEDIHLEEAI